MIDKAKLDILEALSNWEDSDTFDKVQEKFNGTYDSNNYRKYSAGVVANCNAFKEFIEDYYATLEQGLENGFLNGIYKDKIEGDNANLDTFTQFGVYFVSKEALNKENTVVPSKIDKESDIVLCNIPTSTGLLQIVFGEDKDKKCILTYRLNNSAWADIPDIEVLNATYLKLTGGELSGALKINTVGDIDKFDSTKALEVVGNTLFRNRKNNSTNYTTTVKNDFIIGPYGNNGEDTGDLSVSTRVFKSTFDNTSTCERSNAGYYTYNIVATGDGSTHKNSLTINLDARNLNVPIGYAYLYGMSTKAEYLNISTGTTTILHNDILKLDYNQDGISYPFENTELLEKNDKYIVNVQTIYDLYEYVNKNFLFRKNVEIGNDILNPDEFSISENLTINCEVTDDTNVNQKMLKFNCGDTYGGTIWCGNKTFNMISNGNITVSTHGNANTAGNNISLRCDVQNNLHNIETKYAAGMTDNYQSNPQGTYDLGYLSIKEVAASETDITSSVNLCIQKYNIIDNTYVLPYKAVTLQGSSTLTEFIPSVDNEINLGSNSNRWQNIYAASDVITTSDKTLKKNIKNVANKILDKWENVNWVEFKYVGGERKHTGLIAQDVLEAVPEIEEYGALCKDEWDNIYNIEVDPETNMPKKTLVKEAGSLYSLRYNEAQAFENMYLRKKIKELEAKLTALEKKVK